MSFLSSLLEGLEAVDSVSALENKIITWLCSVADEVRKTGDSVVATEELAATLDEHTVAAATAISGKVSALIDQAVTDTTQATQVESQTQQGTQVESQAAQTQRTQA